MRSILDFVRPPEDADWKHVNRWRWNVSLMLLVLAGTIGWMYKNVAWAGDVDKKIAAAIEPLTKEQKEQGQKIDIVAKLLTEQLAESKAAEIRLNIAKRCKSNSASEREALAKEKDRLQEAYKSYKGDYYREPGCGEL